VIILNGQQVDALLELYHVPASTCSQKVRLVLAEKKLDWKAHTLRFSDGTHLTDWYLKLNPNGVVPTLIHNGDSIVDSSVINEYIEDVFPENPVRPTSVKDRARMRAWRQYIDEVPTPAIRVPSFNRFLVHIWQGMKEEEFLDFTNRLPLRKHFYRRMGQDGFSQADVDEALDKLLQTLKRMEASLNEGPWLVGDHYTIADISITPTIVRMDDLELSSMWIDLPRVSDWYRRVRERPNFDVAYVPGSRELAPTC
jgi:glutathione S-transferase